MKSIFVAASLFCSARPLWAAEAGDQANPLDTVVTMLSDMQQKSIKEGEDEQKAYKKYSDYCDDRAAALGIEIKHGEATEEDLVAKVAAEKSDIEKLKARIENLAADVAKDARDLQQAVEVRRKERKDFQAEEKELMETIDTIKQVIEVLGQQKKPSMLQLQNAGNLAQTFAAMAEASLVRTADASKLTALVQAAEGSDESEDDDSAGAPAAEGMGYTVIDKLEDLQDKVEDQLQKTRKTETDAQHGFEMMKAALSDEVRFAQKDMDTVKNGIVTDEEEKSVAEGELTVEEKDLKTDTAAQQELRHACLSRAQNFEASVKSRDAEISVLAKAKQLLKESMASLAQVSFVQISSNTEQSTFQVDKVVRFVRDLGRKQGSNSLMQLAKNLVAATRSTGGDPFMEVKSMISTMITSLEKEVSSAARKKEYCDKELANTKEKKEDTQDDVKALLTKMDRMEAKNGRLTGDEKWLQQELSKLGMTQAQMDKLRGEEKTKYGMSKEMIQSSLGGAQRAIKILKDYFAQDGNQDAGSSAGMVISLLQDVAAKFNAWLMDVSSEEEESANEYNSLTTENKAEKAADEADLGYKQKEVKKNKKRITETSADEEAEEEQLEAVSDYLSQIEKDCTAKPQGYEATQKRRRNEIEGLTQALEILNSGTPSLVQSGAARKQLRGQQGVLAA